MNRGIILNDELKRSWKEDVSPILRYYSNICMKEQGNHKELTE
jgi:hypothetical protein